MTPQAQQPTNSITGSPRTTAAGIVAIIMGGLSLFTQIWGAMHGQAMDPTAATGGVGMIGGGIGLLTASDHATVQAAAQLQPAHQFPTLGGPSIAQAAGSIRQPPPAA